MDKEKTVLVKARVAQKIVTKKVIYDKNQLFNTE